MLKWFPMVWGNLARRKLRTTLTLVSVIISFMLFGLLESFRYSVTTYADDYSNALIVQSRNVPLPFTHVARVREIQGVQSACAYLIRFVQLPAQKRLMLQAVSGDDLFAVHPAIQLDAAARERWHRERLAALIDASLARENGWKVGDRVMLAGSKRVRFQRTDGVNALEVVIAGIYSTTTALAAHGIFTRYDYVSDVLGADRAGLEYIAVRFDPDIDVDVIRSRVDAAFETSAAATKTYSARALLRAYYGTFREIARFAVIALVVSFATLLLIAGSVLLQAQRERFRELAVLQAVGVSRASLVGLLLAEAGLLIVPAAIVGLVAAAGIATLVPSNVDVPFGGSIPAHTWGLGGLLALALVAAIALVPSVQMRRLSLAFNLARE
jgi:putative ABC transport system permease protein